MIRYLVKHKGGIILEGSRRHILSVVGQHQNSSLFVFNLKSDDCGYGELFQTIETLKDGVFMSNFGTKGTYPVLMNSPTVIVLGNQKPIIIGKEIDEKRFRTYSIDKISLIDSGSQNI